MVIFKGLLKRKHKSVYSKLGELGMSPTSMLVYQNSVNKLNVYSKELVKRSYNG